MGLVMEEVFRIAWWRLSLGSVGPGLPLSLRLSSPLYFAHSHCGLNSISSVYSTCSLQPLLLCARGCARLCDLVICCTLDTTEPCLNRAAEKPDRKLVLGEYVRAEGNTENMPVAWRQREGHVAEHVHGFLTG